MKDIILATSNPGKIKELQAILAPMHCIPQKELGITSAEETGLSFIENALIKARKTSQLGNKPALADDSGLVVPALDGQPGIFSARYAGENASDSDNIHLLLSNMKSLRDEARQAYFYCALALVQNETDPTPLIATGLLKGYITQAPEGLDGFGYDPIFFVPQYQCTAAQLPIHTKNQISHRAKALEQLSILLQNPS